MRQSFAITLSSSHARGPPPERVVQHSQRTESARDPCTGTPVPNQPPLSYALPPPSAALLDALSPSSLNPTPFPPPKSVRPLHTYLECLPHPHIDRHVHPCVWQHANNRRGQPAVQPSCHAHHAATALRHRSQGDTQCRASRHADRCTAYRRSASRTGSRSRRRRRPTGCRQSNPPHASRPRRPRCGRRPTRRGRGRPCHSHRLHTHLEAVEWGRGRAWSPPLPPWRLRERL